MAPSAERAELGLLSLIEIAILVVFGALAALNVSSTMDKFRLRKHFNIALDNYLTRSYPDAILELQEECIPAKPDFTGSYRMLLAIQFEQLLAAPKTSLDPAEKVLETLGSHVGQDDPTYCIGQAALLTETARRSGTAKSKVPQALALLEKARKAEPDLSDIDLAIATNKMLLGDVEGARAAVDEALKKKKFSRTALPYLYNLMGVLKCVERKFGEGIAEFQKTRELNPGFKDAQYNSAIAALQGIMLSSDRSEIQKYIGLAERVIQSLPPEQAELQNLGRIAIGLGYTKLDSAKDAGRAYESARGDLSLYNYGLQLARESMRVQYSTYSMRPAAIKKLNEISKELPKEQELQKCLALAALYLYDNNLGQAMTFAKKAVALDESCYVAHRLAGTIAYKAGEYKEARYALEKSLQLKPDQHDVSDLYQTLLQKPTITQIEFFEVALRKDDQPVRTKVGRVFDGRTFVRSPKPVLWARVRSPSTPKPLVKEQIVCSVSMGGRELPAAPAFDKDDMILIVPPPLQPGEITFRIKVSDWAGNTEETTVPVVVDIAKPTFEWNIEKDATITPGKPLFVIKLFDDLSGIDTETIRVSYTAKTLKFPAGKGVDVIDKGIWREKGEKANKGDKATETISFKAPFDVDIPGPVWITVTAADRAGNVGRDERTLKVKGETKAE